MSDNLNKRMTLEKTSSPSITLDEITEFFGSMPPAHLLSRKSEMFALKKLDQKEIMKIIKFAPPFLRLEKGLVWDSIGESTSLSTKMLGSGFVSSTDTEGHYNGLFFLSLCGWLMAQTALIQLASIFTSTSPQIIEASGVKAVTRKLYRPGKQKVRFWTESEIRLKKLQLIVMKTKLTFDQVPFAVAETVKAILAPHNSVNSAIILPE